MLGVGDVFVLALEVVKVPLSSGWSVSVVEADDG